MGTTIEDSQYLGNVDSRKLELNIIHRGKESSLAKFLRKRESTDSKKLSEGSWAESAQAIFELSYQLTSRSRCYFVLCLKTFFI